MKDRLIERVGTAALLLATTLYPVNTLAEEELAIDARIRCVSADGLGLTVPAVRIWNLNKFSADANIILSDPLTKRALLLNKTTAFGTSIRVREETEYYIDIYSASGTLEATTSFVSPKCYSFPAV
jgi:hypothetical protein